MNEPGERRSGVKIFKEEELYADDKLTLDQWRKLAVTDTATGLYNRNWYERYGKMLFDKIVNERGKPLSVLYMDVDNLGILNDLFGHIEVDRLLKGYSDVSKDPKIGFRSSDFVVRMSGDEVVVFLTEADVKEANAAAFRVSNAVRAASNGYMTLSIGIASSETVDTNSLVDLITHADIACSLAKLEKGRQLTYQPGMDYVTHKDKK